MHLLAPRLQRSDWLHYQRGYFGRIVDHLIRLVAMRRSTSDLQHITIVPDRFPDNPTTLSCCTQVGAYPVFDVVPHRRGVAAQA